MNFKEILEAMKAIESEPPPAVDGATLDPDTVDIGADRPLAMIDMVNIYRLKSADPNDHLEQLSRMAIFMMERTKMEAPTMMQMSPDAFHKVLVRVIADVEQKLGESNVRARMLNTLKGFVQEKAH